MRYALVIALWTTGVIGYLHDFMWPPRPFDLSNSNSQVGYLVAISCFAAGSLCLGTRPISRLFVLAKRERLKRIRDYERWVWDR